MGDNSRQYDARQTVETTAALVGSSSSCPSSIPRILVGSTPSMMQTSQYYCKCDYRLLGPFTHFVHILLRVLWAYYLHLNEMVSH
jgi:hypothetical protein